VRAGAAVRGSSAAPAGLPCLDGLGMGSVSLLPGVGRIAGSLVPSLSKDGAGAAALRRPLTPTLSPGGRGGPVSAAPSLSPLPPGERARVRGAARDHAPAPAP